MVGQAAAAAHSSGGHAMQFGLTKGQLVVWTWIVMGIILLLVYLFMRRKEIGVPSKLQNMGEAIVEAIIGLLEPNLGHEMTMRLLPFFGTFLVFIFVSNIFLIIPEGMPPTSDLSTTLALACIALFAAHFLNFKFNGITKAIKHWLNPQPELTKREKLPAEAKMGARIGSLLQYGMTWIIVALLIAFHVIDNGARLLSLSLRLFGNIFGEHVVFHKVSEVAITKPYLVIPLFIPLLILALDTLIFAIQSVVFTYLTLFYLIEEAHLEH